jgi:hypothetical protein
MVIFLYILRYTVGNSCKILKIYIYFLTVFSADYFNTNFTLLKFILISLISII